MSSLDGWRAQNAKYGQALTSAKHGIETPPDGQLLSLSLNQVPGACGFFVDQNQISLLYT